MNRLNGLAGREFANGLGVQSQLESDLKNGTWYLLAQQYKERIKGKVEQSRETSSALPYTSA